MDEILYRAQRRLDRKWVHGYYVKLEDEYRNRVSHRIYSGFAETDCDDFFGDWDEIDPDTLGICLGSEDCNGMEIYTGDVLRSDGYPFSDGDEKDNYYAVACFNDLKGYFYIVKNRLKENNMVSGASEGNCVDLDASINFKVIGTEFDYEFKGLFYGSNDKNDEDDNGDLKIAVQSGD